MQEAIISFRQRVMEFNACVPYAGINPATRVDDSTLCVLLSLLPPPVPAGAPALLPHPKNAIQTIAVLQCLQRLCSSAAVISAVIGTAGERAASGDRVGFVVR
jgi:DnaJ homolog subfamily C member 13